MARPLREFTRFILWMQTERRVAAQPSDQANQLGLWVHRVHFHHRHLLVLLSSPKAGTHFTIPRRA